MSDWVDSAPGYYFAGGSDAYGLPPTKGRRRQSRADMSAEIGRALTRAAAASDRQRCAWHEGGHALALYLRGYPVQEVVIDARGGGHTGPLADGPAWTTEDAATIAWAGAAAERQGLGDIDVDGCLDDRDLIDDLSSDIDVSARAWDDAVDLVRANAAALRALAEALVQRGRLDGPAAEAILAKHGTGRPSAR